MLVNNSIQFDVPTDIIAIEEGFLSKINFPEKRSQQRIKQQSILRVNGQFALLIDLSQNGMKLSTYKIPESPAVTIELTIEDERYQLNGIIRWTALGKTFAGLKNLGIFILNPPIPYRCYVEGLLQAEVD